MAYHLSPDHTWGKPVKFYGAFLINHAANNIWTKGHNRGRQNHAWYTGVLIGQVRKEGDWALEIQYQYNSGTRQVLFSRVKMNVGAEAVGYSITLGTDNYYFIVITYDGTHINGYINGQLVAGPTDASGNGGSAFGHTGFAIGALQTGDTPYTLNSFASIMADECWIFNDALTAAEIKLAYTQGRDRLMLMGVA